MEAGYFSVKLHCKVHIFEGKICDGGARSVCLLEGSEEAHEGYDGNKSHLHFVYHHVWSLRKVWGLKLKHANR